jgi:hypothetical protein
MPYDICWEPHGVLKIYVGHVTGAVFLQAVERVNAHPDFDSFRYVINDFTDCTSFEIESAVQDLAVAAAIGAQRSNPMLIAAFVATDKAILITLQNIADSARSGISVSVFQHLEGARRWVESCSASKARMAGGV